MNVEIRRLHPGDDAVVMRVAEEGSTSRCDRTVSLPISTRPAIS